MLNIFDKIDHKNNESKMRNKQQQVYSNKLTDFINHYLAFAEVQKNNSVHDYISMNIEHIKRLIDLGANINFPYHGGKSVSTMLGFAMKYKHFEFIELLMQNGVNLDQIFFIKDTDISYSAFEYAEKFFTESEKQQFFDLCERYCYKSPNNYTDEQNNNSHTLFLMLANSSEKEIIEFIQTHDINPNYCINKKPLLEILIENNKIDAMFALLDKGADINQPFSDYNHAIIHIFKNNMFSRQLFDKLLTYGLDVNYQNKYLGTPLLFNAVIFCNNITPTITEQGQEFFMALVENNANCRDFDYKNEDIWKKLIYCPRYIQEIVEKSFPRQEGFSNTSNKYYSKYEEFEKLIEEKYNLLDKTTEEAKYFIINACDNFVADAIYENKHISTITKVLKHPYAMPDLVVDKLSFYYDCPVSAVKFVLSFKPDPNSVYMQRALQHFLTNRNYECAQALVCYGTKFDDYWLSEKFCKNHNISETVFNFIKKFAQENHIKQEEPTTPQNEIDNLYSKAVNNINNNFSDDQIEA